MDLCNTSAPKFKHERTTLEFVEKFISKTDWTDCNIRAHLYNETLSLNPLHYAVPFDPNTSLSLKAHGPNFSEARDLLRSEGKPIAVGFKFGPTWSTHWVQLDFSLSRDWLNQEIHLIWDSECEVQIYSGRGQLMQGLSSTFGRTNFLWSKTLSDNKQAGSLFLEIACNDMFGAGTKSQISPPDNERTFTLRKAEIVAVNSAAFTVFYDLEVLIGLVKSIPESSHLHNRALFCANAMVRFIIAEDFSPESWARAHKLATAFFAETGTDKGRFKLHAMGHCHIDTAWLWPYRETKRKCARSWSSTLRLMDQYPQLVFVCSQMLQLDWLRQNYFELFARIQTKVKEKRFIPVGGTWVECDGNIPSGESFVRQLLYGQLFSAQHFGIVCEEFWLPDTFGYSPQLPQIMSLAGIKRFVTQKLSWSLVNKFPHHTFWWQGIDGTKVLTHFPPGDSYCMELTPEDIVKSSVNFRDKGRSKHGMILYGFGDGGGGPTSAMMERLERLKDLDGCPKVIASTPTNFFKAVEAEEANSKQLCLWVGELYLELHNGTYTTHAAVKKKNRDLELLLFDCELINVILSLLNLREPVDVSKEWKSLLLNQFHDVLPGTSIAPVYEDVRMLYDEVENNCADILWTQSAKSEKALLNSLPWTRIYYMEGIPGYVELPPLSITPVANIKCEDLNKPSVYVKTVNCEKRGTLFEVGNRFFEASIDSLGRVCSLICIGKHQREAIAAGEMANVFAMYHDVPLYWDAWDVMDYHLESRKTIENANQLCEIVDQSEKHRIILTFELDLSPQSCLSQRIIVDAWQPYLIFETNVVWKENHKLLKVEFPVAVHCKEATYETQFGHISRPNHFNTSWNTAAFEVCGHKWVDLSEFNFGVALLNDGKYGFSCEGNRLSMSLLRSPKSPDPTADMGEHNFSYALMPHFGKFQECTGLPLNVTQAALEFNCPVRNVCVPEGSMLRSIFRLSSSQVQFSAIKLPEITTGRPESVIRMYEAYGGSCTVELGSIFSIVEASVCDILEKRISECPVTSQGEICLNFSPFQIISIIVVFDKLSR